MGNKGLAKRLIEMDPDLTSFHFEEYELELLINRLGKNSRIVRRIIHQIRKQFDARNVLPIIRDLLRKEIEVDEVLPAYREAFSLKLSNGWRLTFRNEPGMNQYFLASAVSPKGKQFNFAELMYDQGPMMQLDNEERRQFDDIMDELSDKHPDFTELLTWWIKKVG